MLHYKGRSKWKSLNFTTFYFNLNHRNIKNITISFLDIGKLYKSYVGHKVFSFRITEHMVGYKFGQFCLTKKLGVGIHKLKKKVKAKIKRK